MTQSAVSQHIQDLERALGVILFQRMSRGAQPTEAGLRLCDHTDELFRVVAKIEHDLVDIRDTAQRHLTISAAPGVAEYVLPGWIAAFQRRFPNITCLLRTAEPSEALLDLDRRRSDICLVEGLSRVTSEAHNCEWRNVGESDMHLVFGREGGLFSAHSNALSAGERLPIACYEAGTDLRQRTERALRQSAVAWTVGAEFASIEALLRITQSSALCAVVPGYALQRIAGNDRMSLSHLPLPGSTIETVMVRRADQPPSPAAREFFDFVNARTGVTAGPAFDKARIFSAQLADAVTV